MLDSSYQRVKRLFLLAYRDRGGANGVTADSHRRYFFPRVKIENCNIKQYDEIRKIPTGQGDDYTTGSLLDFAYFEVNCRLIAVDLTKQKALDADLKAIQQIIFTGKASAGVTSY